MRLINQMGTVDIPYELCALSIGGMSGKATIYIRTKALDDRPVAFADYSSEEKALKVMEMVRNRYAKLILFQTTYQNGVLEKLTKEFGENEALNIVTPIFRFPKDDEVEDNMAPWQAFILGILVALVILSILYGCVVIEAQEKAYRKGLHDGKNRKSDGNVPELREDT